MQTIIVKLTDGTNEILRTFPDNKKGNSDSIKLLSVWQKQRKEHPYFFYA